MWQKVKLNNMGLILLLIILLAIIIHIIYKNRNPIWGFFLLLSYEVYVIIMATVFLIK